MKVTKLPPDPRLFENTQVEACSKTNIRCESPDDIKFAISLNSAKLRNEAGYISSIHLTGLTRKQRMFLMKHNAYDTSMTRKDANTKINKIRWEVKRGKFPRVRLGFLKASWRRRKMQNELLNEVETGYKIGDKVIALRDKHLDKEGVVVDIKKSVNKDGWILTQLSVLLNDSTYLNLDSGYFMKKTG